MPGDVFTSSQGQQAQLVHGANVLAITAWRQGKLVFDDTPVSEALSQMQRYSRQTVTIDPAVAQIRVSGVFTAGDLEGFVSALKSYYPVTLKADGQGGMILSPR
jgi:transmembrane sensor